MNNFNFIAPVYDFLARLVFFGAIKRSQLALLSELKSCKEVLIVGGGSGWILSALDALQAPMKITYLEKSTVMLGMSKNRRPLKYLKVDFVLGDIQELPKVIYDGVITNYFLDVLSEVELKTTMSLIDTQSSANVKWLCTDFKPAQVWYHRPLLSIMFLFFKLTAQIGSKQILDFDKYFRGLNYNQKMYRHFYNQLIKTAIYEKN
ncbi:class I SAM-dependent methyltransferase [Fulvivirga sp. RKSG066]|uniref:class I SAM-dependent methyltransferase n=1 Tax=Fulvivirga aurantia TaxID=2529383 RepID=UPI0012BBF758|nr:class I SAM-dependent methyltransferase [Fulvivirga aurantia]MTI20624.1 class I SAM-dependent methyltransferase [Fulvivirga aurantia]